MHLQNHSMQKLKRSGHSLGEAEIYHSLFLDYAN